MMTENRTFTCKNCNRLMPHEQGHYLGMGESACSPYLNGLYDEALNKMHADLLLLQQGQQKAPVNTGCGNPDCCDLPDQPVCNNYLACECDFPTVATHEHCYICQHAKPCHRDQFLNLNLRELTYADITQKKDDNT